MRPTNVIMAIILSPFLLVWSVVQLIGTGLWNALALIKWKK
jgi:hypothetical protein